MKNLPPYTPRLIDPLTQSISLNRIVSPKEEFYYYVGKTSTTLKLAGKLNAPTKTELGGMIKQDSINKLSTKIIYNGVEKDTIQQVFTPSEIHDELGGYGFIDCRAQQRGVQHKIPKIMEQHMEGEDKLLTLDVARSNQTNKMRRSLNAPWLANLRLIGKQYALDKNIISRPSDSRIREQRSAMCTDWFGGLKTKTEDIVGEALPLLGEIQKPYQLLAITEQYFMLNNGQNISLMRAKSPDGTEYDIVI